MNSRIFERTLIYLPIIHTQSDLGALGESIRRIGLRKVGKQSMQRKIELINRVWTEIENAIDRLDLSYESVRLYQDGLPVCGREVEIVSELASAGGRNHQLLMRLMDKGATLMGTESPELLIVEYERAKQITDTENILKKDRGKALQKRSGDQLLKKRDRYIAGRINTTLDKGETGLLFLGMLHSLQGLLDRDIRVIYPVRRIVFQGG
ncbi:MAG: hypothetical protein R6U40_07815 [Desulfobacterales bacterium]